VLLDVGFELRQVLLAPLDGAVLVDHLVAGFPAGVELTQSDQGTDACLLQGDGGFEPDPFAVAMVEDQPGRGRISLKTEWLG
jgi:hypothetical protein